MIEGQHCIAMIEIVVCLMSKWVMGVCTGTYTVSITVHFLRGKVLAKQLLSKAIRLLTCFNGFLGNNGGNGSICYQK